MAAKKSPTKISVATSSAPASSAADTQEAPESPTKKPQRNLYPGGKSLTVNTSKNQNNTNDVSDGATTEDDSPSKMSYGEGQSPVRTMPSNFQREKANQF